jgi:[acyl-carrier-protein] S-malonyltransferase
MFVAGLAGLEKLRAARDEAVLNYQATAGLSLGEYTALCAAGVFSFEDGLRLVHIRGEAMQDAATKSKQLMLSVAGIPRAKLSGLCEESAKHEGKGAVCQIANELFPDGFACAGTAGAIEKLLALTQSSGALQSKILKTSGGFHTPLMESAKLKLSQALDEVLPRMQPPKHAVFMNVTGQMVAPGTEPATIVDLLKQQLTTAVLWETTMRNMISAGIKEFYECGPMKQLTAMMKRIDPPTHKAMKNVSV